MITIEQVIGNQDGVKQNGHMIYCCDVCGSLVVRVVLHVIWHNRGNQ
jgi:hypothetical protein